MNQQFVRCRRGFTLIEVLIVMTILIILTGLVAVGARVAINSSKTSATKVLVSQLEAALNQKIERFLRDTQAVSPIQTYRYWAGGTDSETVTPTSDTGRRAAIISKLDAMRSAFPQSFSEMVPSVELLAALSARIPGWPEPDAQDREDFIEHCGHSLNDSQVSQSLGKLPTIGVATAPVVNPYQTHQTLFVRYLIATGQIANASEFSQLGGYIIAGVNSSWPARNLPTASPDRFLDGSPRTYANPITGQVAGPHDPATESSECLYLILSDRSQGESGIEAISAQFIRDTDNDGLLEFVDAWGKPIRFYRWATDTFAYWMEVTKQYPFIATADAELDGVVDSNSRPLTKDGIGNNAMDGEGYLYSYEPVSGNSVWWPLGGTAIGPMTNSGGKDIFECYFARLHRAYNYESANSEPIYSLPISNPVINSDPVNGRNNTLPSGKILLNGNQPRVYPFRPLIVSAGPDGEFGMYDLNSDWSGQGNGANSGTIYPQIQLGYRCGRVEEDPARRPYFQDNIVAVELQEGVKQ